MMLRMLFWGLRKARRLRYQVYSIITILTLVSSAAAYTDNLGPVKDIAEDIFRQAGRYIRILINELDIKQPDLPIHSTGAKMQPDSNSNSLCKVHFIDVGQGDSILIQLPTKEVALIDGGDRDDAKQVTEYIKKQGIKKIDYLLVTHPHSDHLGALPSVVKTFEIGNIYMPKVTANTEIFKSLLTEINNKGLKIKQAKAGVDIINSQDLKFYILAPGSDKYDEINEYSIVAKLTYKNNSYLFTGDSEKVSESEMIKSGYDLKADVLKVAHHGGSTSSTTDFLKQVSPKYSVISVGKDNIYGHPHKELIERLTKAKTSILRTDQHGNILITTDGKEISVKTSKGK